MKLTPYSCPECGRDARYIIETVATATPLDPVDQEGRSDPDWFRGIEILWDSIRPEVVDGKVTVSCAKYHEWRADMQASRTLLPTDPPQSRLVASGPVHRFSEFSE
jgi:hypothetical protein